MLLVLLYEVNSLYKYFMDFNKTKHLKITY